MIDFALLPGELHTQHVCVCIWFAYHMLIKLKSVLLVKVIYKGQSTRKAFKMYLLSNYICYFQIPRA